MPFVLRILANKYTSHYHTKSPKRVVCPISQFISTGDFNNIFTLEFLAEIVINNRKYLQKEKIRKTSQCTDTRRDGSFG